MRQAKAARCRKLQLQTIQLSEGLSILLFSNELLLRRRLEQPMIAAVGAKEVDYADAIVRSCGNGLQWLLRHCKISGLGTKFLGDT